MRPGNASKKLDLSKKWSLVIEEHILGFVLDFPGDEID
jgi:hypothetical protein